MHCITNAVAQNFTANMLLAAGAVPSMTIAPREIEAFVARADALLVNLGTFDAERQKASLAAIAVANKQRMPWVLDPVFIDRSKPRAAFAKTLAAQDAAGGAAQSRRIRGARPAASPTTRALARYAKARRTVVGLTGASDLVQRRRAACDHRQRPCADGARHRHGLRRLGAGRRLPCGRARRLAGDRVVADR